MRLFHFFGGMWWGGSGGGGLLLICLGRLLLRGSDCCPFPENHPNEMHEWQDAL